MKPMHTMCITKILGMCITTCKPACVHAYQAEVKTVDANLPSPTQTVVVSILNETI